MAQDVPAWRQYLSEKLNVAESKVRKSRDKVLISNTHLNMSEFEKDRTDFPNYNENYLYFTAIKFNN